MRAERERRLAQLGTVPNQTDIDAYQSDGSINTVIQSLLKKQIRGEHCRSREATRPFTTPFSNIAIT